MSDVTILLSSSGRRGALLELLRDGGDRAGLAVRVVAADCSPLSAAGQLADHFELVPRVTEDGYLAALIDLVQRERIDVIVPTIDTELRFLAEHRETLENAGASVLVSSVETIDTFADKRLSSRWLSEAGFPVPTQYPSDQLDAVPADRWPLFFKPIQGSSSIGAGTVRSPEEVRSAVDRFGEGVVEELVVGEEYTVDCWVDPSGACVGVVPRLRIATRAGETAKGRTVAQDEVSALAKEVVEALPGARGPITVQIMAGPDGPRIIEINPRFAGGYPLTHGAGASFTAALAAECADKPVDPAWFTWTPDTVMLRYDAAVFVSGEELDALER